MQRKLGCYLQGQGHTVKDYIAKINELFRAADSFAVRLSLMVHHHKLESHVKR